MLRYRIIPTLLLINNGLYKTVQFKNPIYVGDPINAVKIFNEKEVDELILLDIKSTVEKREINFEKIREIVSEAFMPIGYGGGINNLNQIEELFNLGIEKVVFNSSAFNNSELIESAARKYGNQSIVVSLDVKKDFWGNYKLYTHSGQTKQRLELIEAGKHFENLGAGELFVNSIDKDGTLTGYDLNLIKIVSKSVNIPVIASGGANSIQNFSDAIKSGASAVAAGSMFVFHGKHRAVLISYPKYEELERLIS